MKYCLELHNVSHQRRQRRQHLSSRTTCSPTRKYRGENLEILTQSTHWQIFIHGNRATVLHTTIGWDSCRVRWWRYSGYNPTPLPCRYEQNFKLPKGCASSASLAIHLKCSTRVSERTYENILLCICRSIVLHNLSRHTSHLQTKVP